MTEVFATKWGVDVVDLEVKEDPKQCIVLMALAQIVCTISILYVVKPNFVMHRYTFDSVECFYWPSAFTIAILIATLTYCYPYVMRR